MKKTGHFLVLFFVMLLGACGVTDQHGSISHGNPLLIRNQKREGMRVLFVGNSYSFGVPKEFAKLAARRGKTVSVEQETYPGWTLARHAGRDETLAKIRSQDWDFVVLQEQSLLPGQPARRAMMMFPSVEKLTAEVRLRGAVPVLYQTWGRRDGFLAMNRRVREGYRLAAEKAGGVAIVPVGDAWEREFTAGRGALLFSPDGSHPSQRGNEISAEVFYEAFFGRN